MSNFIQDNSSDFSDMVKQKIAEFNAQHWDAAQRQPLGLKKLNEQGEPLAALAGRTFGNWLYVESLWLAESERGLGTGRAILAEAEALARLRGCRFVVLDTLDFQARPFYEKQGYTVQWTQQDYPFAGGAKYFMVKAL